MGDTDTRIDLDQARELAGLEQTDKHYASELQQADRQAAATPSYADLRIENIDYPQAKEPSASPGPIPTQGVYRQQSATGLKLRYSHLRMLAYLGVLVVPVWLYLPEISQTLSGLGLQLQEQHTERPAPRAPSVVVDGNTAPPDFYAQGRNQFETGLLIPPSSSEFAVSDSLAMNDLDRDTLAMQPEADTQTPLAEESDTIAAADAGQMEPLSVEQPLQPLEQTQPTAEDNELGKTRAGLLMHHAILDAIAFGREATYLQKKEHDLSSLEELYVLTKDEFYRKHIHETKKQIIHLKANLESLSELYGSKIRNICYVRPELIPGALQTINQEYIHSQGIEKVSLEFFVKQLDQCATTKNSGTDEPGLSKTYIAFMNNHIANNRGRNQ